MQTRDKKKKGIVKKATEKIKEKIVKPKRIELIDMDEAALKVKEGYKVVEVRSEIKGSDIAPTIPKTWVLEK